MREGRRRANTDELTRQMDELTQKLGPEYAALMAAYRDMDLDTKSGLETGATVQATIQALNRLCAPRSVDLGETDRRIRQRPLRDARREGRRYLGSRVTLASANRRLGGQGAQRGKADDRFNTV
jgi:hypothetical protein